jgi:polysaccharide biosynthesis/export protein
MNMAQKIRFGLSALCMTCVLTTPARAELSSYRIAPGETIEINISSLPNGSVRAVVQTDGTIALSDVGLIEVAGLTPAELQMRLEAVLPTKLFHVRAGDGKVQTHIIASSDITSTVVAYRPIYVGGAVFNPGEQPYRPLLTVRQAIAVSGGPSLIRSQATKGGTDTVDLQRDYQSLWTEFLKAHFHRERIQAEMQGVAEFDSRPPAGSPLPAKLASAIAASEMEALKIALEDKGNEQVYLQTSVAAAAEQVDTLAEREKVEAAAEKADQQDLAKVVQLLKSGNQTNDRVAETRRSLLLTSSRRLETLVELMRVRTQRSDTTRKIEQSGNQNKIKLLDDLRDTNVLLANLEVKLQAVGTKLQVRDIGTSVEPQSGDTEQSGMTIMRKVGGQWQKIPAGMESELLPGDVLDVPVAGASAAASVSVPTAREDASEDNKISMN